MALVEQGGKKRVGGAGQRAEGEGGSVPYLGIFSSFSDVLPSPPRLFPVVAVLSLCKVKLLVVLLEVPSSGVCCFVGSNLQLSGMQG